MVYDGMRKYNTPKKDQKCNCIASCTVLHLYLKLIERTNPKIQTKTRIQDPEKPKPKSPNPNQKPKPTIREKPKSPLVRKKNRKIQIQKEEPDNPSGIREKNRPKTKFEKIQILSKNQKQNPVSINFFLFIKKEDLRKTRSKIQTS